MKAKKKKTLPKKAPKSKTKPKGILVLALEGDVFVIEKDNKGKEISKAKIDGETVLKCLVFHLEAAVKNFK
jgi:hypothetical protein